MTSTLAFWTAHFCVHTWCIIKYVEVRKNLFLIEEDYHYENIFFNFLPSMWFFKYLIAVFWNGYTFNTRNNKQTKRCGFWLFRFADIFTKHMRLFLICLYIGASVMIIWFTLLIQGIIASNTGMLQLTVHLNSFRVIDWCLKPSEPFFI